KAINEKQHEHIEEAQQMQDRLFDYVVQGKELADIINYVENELQCSIVFTDHYGRIKSSAIKRPQHLIQLWSELTKEQKVIKKEIDSFSVEKIAYNDGYLVKKEIQTNVEQISDGYFIIHFHDKNALQTSTLQ